MTNEEWFKLRKYPHIGLPITAKEKSKVCKYVKDSKKISKHSFLPFIHKQIHSKRTKKQYDEFGSPRRNHENKKVRKTIQPKIRDIYYASHLDANIYSYYSSLLMKNYENLLVSKELNEVVTAYRKIRHNQNRNKCNIDFANEVFNYIRENNDRDLVAIAVDITGFFDNLDHKILKKSWCKVMNYETLPIDHYKVFKSITKYSHIEENLLFKIFKNEILTEKNPGFIKRKKVKRIEYMKTQNAIAFCEKKDIHKIRSNGLIVDNKYDKKGKLKDYGICQGSPISSTLANLYMLDFDDIIYNKVKEINGLYRRYSDDIVVICDKEHKEQITSLLNQSIVNVSRLEIKAEKTQIFHFEYRKNKRVCLQEFSEKINSNSINSNFEYLGFSFDGEQTYLKTSSLSRYYRKMKSGVRRRAFYSKRMRNDSNGKIFNRALYKQYSYIGSYRSLKYKRVFGKTDQWKKTSVYNWGNFITYTNMASKILDSNKVKKQTKNHWKNLNKEISKF